MTTQTDATSKALTALPDELLEAIVFYLPPKDAVRFGAACRQSNKITHDHLVWQRHCLQTYKYWEPKHEISERKQLPPAQTKWKRLFIERQNMDKEALQLFDSMLEAQQKRTARMEEIAGKGYDVKDLLVKLRDKTPDDAEDVLARRYYANAILGQLHRKTALEQWNKLQRHEMVSLESVLGAYDLFVLGGGKGDLGDISQELDRIAQCIRLRDPEFDDLSIRKKAVQIAKYLRSEQLVGNPSQEDYHALRNNFISIALFDDVHTSLPLQSVAIYCCVARRLGVNAKPSNYPMHVHAVIEAPETEDLDGRPTMLNDATSEARAEDGPATMHMDPWRSSEEVPTEELTTRLIQMGVPPQQNAHHLGATSMLEMALRTGRNIMNSVQEARDRQRGTTRRATVPDVESAWYSMLWSMVILGDSNSAATLHRRRQCLPYLLEHFQQHFPEDLNLIENVLVPMFEGEREHHILMHLISQGRAADENAKPITKRNKVGDVDLMTKVKYKIGHYFQHKRYGYEGIVFGWAPRCEMGEQWIRQMGVDTLPNGRDQPFFNCL